ncbi:MAG TPA: TrkA family potassium uptake protein [Candidatus Tectomicrobia bacterium]|nr:TrkA family potassium uptake protein [Candidatus Tectomicrobia bacterium]
MFILIAGGGLTAAHLATLLVQRHHQVRLIEHRREVLTRLHRELPTEVIYEGIATDPQVLEQAGIWQADVLAACSSNDVENLVLCFFGRTRYHVPRTIARINNPRNAWLFDHKFHVDVALNQSEILATLIEEEMSLGDMMILLRLRRGRYSLVQERVHEAAPAVGIALKDLSLPPNSVIAAILRQDQILIPRGITQFQAGDEVLAIVDREAAEELSHLFGDPHATLEQDKDET